MKKMIVMAIAVALFSTASAQTKPKDKPKQGYTVQLSEQDFVKLYQLVTIAPTYVPDTMRIGQAKAINQAAYDFKVMLEKVYTAAHDTTKKVPAVKPNVKSKNK